MGQHSLGLLAPNQNGFSFIGVAFLILASSVAITTTMIKVSSLYFNAEMGKTNAKMERIKVAFLQYRSDHAGAAPTSLQNLITQVGAGCAMDTNSSSASFRKFTGWCGPYLRADFSQIPNDPITDDWGELFQLSGGNVKSCGPNRICGDSDDLSIAI